MKNLSYINLINVTILGSSTTGFLCLSLLDASIKSLLILVVSTGICVAMVRASAATRHMIWATTMLGLLLMPACAMILPQWRVLPSWLSLENRFEREMVSSEPVANFNSQSTNGPLEYQASNPTDFVMDAAPRLASIPEESLAMDTSAPPRVLRLSAALILGVWTGGFVMCLLPIVLAWLRLLHTERVLQDGQPIPKKIVRRISALASELKIREPRIIVGPVGTMPMVWTLVRSRLLLPADIEHWETTRIKSVLFHELVHLKRRDPTCFVFGLIARAINWFNPLAWYALHRLRLECERACDDQVLRMGVDASEYAGHLLALSTSVRATAGTGSMALAMANKPNVENRILCILDENKNRCGVTLRRAMAMLIAVLGSVTVMATLAATASQNANDLSIIDQDDVGQIKYPHCIVETENLQSRSLAEAIAAFNKVSFESPTGSTQRPITENETLDAISEFMKQEHVPAPVKKVFQEIAENKTLPANAYFRRFTRFSDGNQMHGVWWVRLYVESTTPPVYSVPVRTTSIFTRPYTQLERKQNVDGITLLNRFASYFETQPTMSLHEALAKDPADRLKAALQRAIYAHDLDGALELFHWHAVGDSTREFVKSELKTLMQASVLSIKFEPVTLDGKMLHWSAYQHFVPNLPVVGFMNIEYTPQEQPFTAPSKETYLLDSGDILGVLIDGVLPYKSDSVQQANPAGGYPIVVQDNGTIGLPSINAVAVKGLSMEQATEQIKKAYLDAKIFTEPSKLRPIVTLVKKRMTWPKKTLSLELGKFENDFRIVNYIANGERKMPDAPNPGHSIRGHMEKLADGSFLMTDVITNPGSLISAHLANEEIRLLDFGNLSTNSEESVEFTKERPSLEAIKKRLEKWNGVNERLRNEIEQIKNEKLEQDKRQEPISGRDQKEQEIVAILGRITNVENDGETVYIDLGKADGLRPGVRFGVVGIDFSFGIHSRPKTTIEVTEVVSTSKHLSKCKVIRKKNSTSIQTGDGIYSPAWKPVDPVGFAFLGKMDIDGDGQDDRDQVKALIEENGGRVVFELSASGKIIGDIDYCTRWLVIGEGANDIEGAGLAFSKAKEFGVSSITIEKLMRWLQK